MKIQEFDFHVDLLKSLLWEYNDATALQSIIEQEQAWYNENQEQFWLDWYRDVFNLDTANDFGCSVWAIILGIPLSVVLTPAPISPTFGFGSDNENFGNGNFSNINGTVINLTLEQKRLVLKLRYFQLITRGAVTEVNAFLKYVFADFGNVYVLDGLDMTATYVLTFTPSAALNFVLKNYDLLPRPAGVKVNYLTIIDTPFGFGPNNVNFNNGNFIES